MKQQLLIINSSRRRAPSLSALDRCLLGFWSLFLSPRHIQRAAVIIRAHGGNHIVVGYTNYPLLPEYPFVLHTRYRE
jgi:hypothetical protein